MKAQQCLYHLWQLRRFSMNSVVLRSFYNGTIESILTGNITCWFGNCTTFKHRPLHRVVQTTQRIIGGEIPSLQDIYIRRCVKRSLEIIKDHSHPSHILYPLWPSGRQHSNIRAHMNRLRDSFIPQIIWLLNNKKFIALKNCYGVSTVGPISPEGTRNNGEPKM